MSKYKFLNKDGVQITVTTEEALNKLLSEGWTLGRISSEAQKLVNQGSYWVNNGKESLHIKKTDPIPEGYVRGRLTDKIWITNDIDKPRQWDRAKPIPEGWHKGRGHFHTEEAIEKNRQSHTGSNNVRFGTHWTEEMKAKRRETMSRKSPEERETWKKKISKAVTGTKWSKEAKAKQSVMMKSKWKNDDYIKMQVDARESKVSKGEQEIFDFIKSIYSGIVYQSYRGTDVIGPKELDIYIPEKNVAIEYNGLVWHSAMKEALGYGALDPNAIREKSDECRAKGIRLIHVREDQWRDKQDIVKSIIASSLGVYQHKYFARKLKFLPIDSKTANEFLDHNHIKGGTRCKAAFGLYNGLQLLQVVTFRPKFVNSKSNRKGLELARMATLKNCQVVGGFSRLMKDSLRALGETSCESYVDLALFNASGYNSSGWTVVKPNVGIGYAYTDSYSVLGRQCFMKKSCYEMWKSDYSDVDYKDLSEAMMTSDHGWFPIYDAGNALVEYNVA